MTESKRRRQPLPFKRKVAVCHYLETRREALLEQRPRHESVAGEATASLGFTVTTAVLRSCLRACGFDWKSKRAPGPRAGGRRSEAKSRMRADIRFLAAELAAVRASLGMPPSPGLIEIADRIEPAAAAPQEAA